MPKPNARHFLPFFSFPAYSAVAQWGDTDFSDATGGEQPRFTTVSDNICHDIGHYQKQSSCYFQAQSCQNTVTRNVMFNVARAAIK
jgi:hypothetical protein